MLYGNETGTYTPALFNVATIGYQHPGMHGLHGLQQLSFAAYLVTRIRIWKGCGTGSHG
jgi:hypothetical protein